MRVAVKMFVESKMLYTSYSRAVKLCFLRQMLLLQEEEHFIFRKSNVLLPNMKQTHFPGSGICCRASLWRWHMLRYEIWFLRYKSIKLYCNKNIDTSQRVQCKIQTKLTKFSKMLDLSAILRLLLS